MSDIHVSHYIDSISNNDENRRALWSFMSAQLQHRRIQSLSCGFTVGIEVEFFLENADGTLATLEVSEKFIRGTADLPNWHFGTTDEKGLSFSSIEYGSGRYAKLKYEYAPHLLEIAFSFCNDLNILLNEMKAIWDDLYNIAHKQNVKISVSPFCDPDQAVRAPVFSKRTSALNDSRKEYLELLGRNLKLETYLFTSYMAGTQVHIGGLQWWINPQLIRNLYFIESLAPLIGSSLVAGGVDCGIQVIEKRTQLYVNCFPDMTLVAFPDLDDWTIDLWIDGLLNSPLVKSDLGLPTAIAYNAIPSSSRPPIGAVVPLLRDLQYIKPRSIGTVEFRSDPAIGDIQSLIGLASWRLAQAIMCQNIPTYLHKPFKQLRSNWDTNRKIARVIPDSISAQYIDLAIEVLKARGLGEELFLRGIL